MGTSANVAYEEDGVYYVAHVYHAGELEHLGLILLREFGTLDKAKDLVRYGDIRFVSARGEIELFPDHPLMKSRGREDDDELDADGEVKAPNPWGWALATKRARDVENELYAYLWRDGGWGFQYFDFLPLDETTSLQATRTLAATAPTS